MVPKILCTKCSTEVTAGDKFCSSCGAKIEWEHISVHVPASDVSKGKESAAQTFQCSLCGHENAIERTYCESCGNLLRRGASQMPEQTTTSAKASQRSKTTIFQFLQSWKLTLAMAVLFIAVLLILQTWKHDRSSIQNMSLAMVNPAIISEIEMLEKNLSNNPKDKVSLLRLANLLQDVRLFSKAIERYQHYLELDPDNPDARIDLGVTYFNFALSDSTHYLQFLNRARQEIETAIQIAPRHQLGLYNLGIVNLHLGEIEKASEWFMKCAAIDSTTETGRKALHLIHQHSFTNQS